MAEQPAADRHARHRIQIDPQTGAVRGQMLQVIDSPFATGEPSCFVGSIETELADETEAKTLATRIRKGLEYAGSLGAMKTAGYGRITKVEVIPRSAADPAALTPARDSQATRLGLSLRFDRPVCVARPHAGNNRYESEDRIPGAVIRGAIAARIFAEDRSQAYRDPRFAALCTHFNAVRIAHAVPVAASTAPDALKRPQVPPLSLVEAPDAPRSPQHEPNTRLYDVALMTQPAGLIRGQAPAFAMDWKSGGIGNREAAARCGKTSPPRRIEVRTAIEPGTGAAKDAALFATEALVPDDFLWLSEIDLSAVPEDERPAVAAALTTLLSEPLHSVGKTKARAVARLHPPFEPQAERGALLRDGLACICLQSPARLLPTPYGLPGTGGAAELFQRYAKTWNDLSGGQLKLLRFFAQQELVGGGYLQERFWSERGAYNPELLTCAGSVFILEPVADLGKAHTVLEAWRDHGLGQPTGAPGGERWDQNPYIRHNGYGEVAINLNLHWDLKPSEAAWYGLE